MLVKGLEIFTSGACWLFFNAEIHFFTLFPRLPNHIFQKLCLLKK